MGFVTLVTVERLAMRSRLLFHQGNNLSVAALTKRAGTFQGTEIEILGLWTMRVVTLLTIVQRKVRIIFFGVAAVTGGNFDIRRRMILMAICAAQILLVSPT